MSASQIATSLQSVIEARATGLAEADVLASLHTPEIDSLAEDIAHADDIPFERKRQLLARLNQAITLNDLQGDHERSAAGLLDEIVRVQHRRECEGLATVLGVLGLARALRPHLAVLANAGAHDGPAYFVACASVRDITRTMTETQLASPSLRKQLGGGRHDLLLTLTAGLA